jgi:hypothetical protein
MVGALSCCLDQYGLQGSGKIPDLITAQGIFRKLVEPLGIVFFDGNSATLSADTPALNDQAL